MRVGIVGAGVSGLVCAQRLLSLAGPALQLTVFEWGRGPGGRTARRRVTLDSGVELSFDHAAPRFTANAGSDFDALLREWSQKGLAEKWVAAGDDVWVGTPSNHAICKGLAAEIEAAGASLHFGRHVRTATYDAGSRAWTVRASCRATETDEEHTFDALVLSDKLLVLPNPYAVLAPADVGALALPATLASTGAVVLMLALEHPPSDNATTPSPPALLSATRGDALAPPLALLAHDSAKPGRAPVVGAAMEAAAQGGREEAGGALDLWVAHSTSEYAAAHLRADDGAGPGLDDPAAVLAEMQAAALATLRASSVAARSEAGGGAAAAADGDAAASEETTAARFAPRVVHASVFAWDHAQTTRGSRVAGATHSLDTARRAGVCGDFFAGATGLEGVEAAAVSGASIADALLPLLRDSRSTP